MSNTALLGFTFPTADTFVLGGDACPGKATLIRGNSPRPWDVRKGYAMSGATVVPKGDDLSHIEFLVELWDPIDFALFKAFAKKYLDKSCRLIANSPFPMALGISHPVVNAPPISVSSVVIEDLSPLVNDGYGLWSCTITFLQYRKPKPALQKPIASIPAVAVEAPTAQTAAEVEIAQKTAELAQLAGP